MKKVRLGIIGTSWWSDMHHIPAFDSHVGVDIVAICGRNRERAEEMAKKYQIPNVYTDYREMVDNGELEAIAILTPDDQHHEMTLYSLNAHLHVLCEKPLSVKLLDAQEMCRKAEEVGVKHMVFFTWKWFPYYQHLNYLVSSGFVGQPFHYEIAYRFGGNRSTGSYSWRYDAQRANGALGDLGSHCIDLARWMFGDISAVFASLDTFTRCPDTEMPANDSAVLFIKHANISRGIIHASNVSIKESRGIHYCTIQGSEGLLELDISFEKMEIRGAQNGEDIREIPVPDSYWIGIDRTQPIMDQISQYFKSNSVGGRLFIDAILQDMDFSPNFYDGLKVQEVIDAALQSNDLGKWVNAT